MAGKLKSYVHHDLNRAVTAIGGHYRFTDEVRLRFEGREILYLKGYALFDTTCCGAGGCGYVLVQGVVEAWKERQDQSGAPVSRVRPVRDPAARQRLRRWILETEMVQQVCFAE